MRKKTGRVGTTFHGCPRLYARKIINGAILGLILIFTLGKLAMAEVWQKIVTSGTPPDKRNGHVLIYPGKNNEQYVFGGFDQNNDLWVLKERGETSEWERRDTIGTAPNARGGHSGIFVPEDGAVVAEDSIIIFGGSQDFEGVLVDSATYKLEEPWSWDPIWEKLSTWGDAPSSRAEHTAVYEDGMNRMIVFGGYTSITPVVVSSGTYNLDLSVLPSGSWEDPIWGAIPGRYGHSAVWSDSQMIVFGGRDNSKELLNDCWRLEWSIWNEINVTGDKPTARWQHTAVWIRGDPMTMEPGGMLIFGGKDENGNPLDDVWVLQQPFGETNWKWEKLYSIGDLPSARAGHAVASGWGWSWGWGWNGGEEKMFIFGGSDGNENFNDIYAFARAKEVKKTLQEKPFNVPNPFNPDTEETKICYYLDEDDDVKIKLFTLTGDLVYSWENISGREGLNQESWDGRNEKGRIVENGGYICLIEAGGKKQKCKIAVLR